MIDDIPFPNFNRNSPVTLAILHKNELKGPVAVGLSLMSSDEILKSGMKGIFFENTQVIFIFRQRF